MSKKEEKCFKAKEKEGKLICDITKYKCPFKGEYHVLEDKDGTNYVIGGERTGCEVCYAYNLGQDYAKFNGQPTKVFAVCAGDAEKFQEPDKFFQQKIKRFNT